MSGRAQRTTPGTASAGSRRIKVARFGRYLVPLDDAGLLDFFVDNLYVAHNRSERLLRPLLSSLAPRLAGRAAAEILDVEVGDDEIPSGGAAMPAVVAGLRAATGPLAPDDLSPLTGTGNREPLRWIFRGGDAAPRSGVLFLFGLGDDEPVAVVKLAGAGGRLQHEHAALERCRRQLPTRLRATLPKPLGFYADDSFQFLALGWRQGRSAYHDLYRDLSSDRRSERHFSAAASWLADFQGAVASAPEEPVPGHGDFWPGNLLLVEPPSVGASRPGDPAAPRGVSASADHAGLTVLDWEGFAPSVSPFDDLFQFPFTYGLHYPWEGYRRAAPEQAFARAFLEETGLSGRVRHYLEVYCSRVGRERGSLQRAFVDWLEHRQARSARQTRRSDEKGVPWKRLHGLIAGADRSVFSG